MAVKLDLFSVAIFDRWVVFLDEDVLHELDCQGGLADAARAEDNDFIILGHSEKHRFVSFSGSELNASSSDKIKRNLSSKLDEIILCDQFLVFLYRVIHQSLHRKIHCVFSDAKRASELVFLSLLFVFCYSACMFLQL